MFLEEIAMTLSLAFDIHVVVYLNILQGNLLACQAI